MGWPVQTMLTWNNLIRQSLADALGYTPDWDGTLEGQWTATVGAVAWTADQGYQIAVDSLDPRTARGSALDRAVSPYVYRKAAVKSRYTCTVDDDALIPTGSVYRDTSANSWVVVAGGEVSAGDELILEAAVAGQVLLSQSAPTTLVPVTALSRPSDLTYTPGDTYSVGRPVETDSDLLRRWSLSLARPASPTAGGIRRTVTAVPWVEVCSPVRVSASVLTIYVSPGPVGADQETELAEAIYSCIGASDVTDGTDSTTITGVDGRDVTIEWTPATTQTVTVVVVLSVVGVTVADVTPAVEAAVQSVFDGLGVGDTLYRLAVLTAIGQVSGVVGCTLTLNGSGSANVVPSTAVTLLTVGTLTVS